MMEKNKVYKVKKTIELSKKEMLELINLINLVFYEEEKSMPKKMNEKHFKEKYINNCKKYSYHGLIFQNNKIISCYSVIPREYNFFNKIYIFGLAVDTLTHPLHRGYISDFKRMAEKVYEILLEEKIPFVFGFPNKNIKNLREKVLKWKNISSLNLYVHINSILNLRFFEKNIFKFLFNLIFKFYFFITKSLFFFESKKIFTRSIFENQNNLYLNSRSKKEVFLLENNKFSINYNIYNDIKIEGNSKVLYIININPVSKKNLSFAVEKLLILHKDVEVIVYASNINFFIKNLLLVPKKIAPFNFNAQGLILNKEQIDERIFDGKNWMLEFSNFDVR